MTSYFDVTLVLLSFNMSSKQSWDNLPDIAIIEVYSYLPDNDRLSMSLACKNWRRLFETPVLWRCRKVIFKGLVADEIARHEITFLRLFGRQLHKLSIGFTGLSFRTCRDLALAADTYLSHLMKRTDVHLDSISFEELNLERFWPFVLSRNKLITALCRLLRKQRTLKTINMISTRLTLIEGCRVLEALGRYSAGTTVEIIFLENVFRTSVIPYENIRYVNALNRFQAIRFLHINYKYLREDILRNLAKTLESKFEQLNIIIEGRLVGEVISSKAWKALHGKCPNLRIGIYIYTTALENDPLPTLVDGMKIQACYIFSWSDLSSRKEELGKILRHVGGTYASSLGTWDASGVLAMALGDNKLQQLVEEFQEIRATELVKSFRKTTIKQLQTKLELDLTVLKKTRNGFEVSV
ncbi:hypothetical protein CHS0354_028360 [Potamilus streckersoni]|uniref:F-box domain-containing protein n=1 Tax=Potamilus streckersoni TaxID=2493646 RepID=A0AAE0RU20_9BIVA|nr:hypothetical protein CHS0354_028360 [Potamilus streckersoni]